MDGVIPYQCMSRINDPNGDDSIDRKFKHASRALRLSGRTDRLVNNKLIWQTGNNRYEIHMYYALTYDTIKRKDCPDPFFSDIPQKAVFTVLLNLGIR
ncbi:unnamed protein product [Wuchereria bancrofti]|nr:unnamed protein product [Wuchereria bancrofti]